MLTPNLFVLYLIRFHTLTLYAIHVYNYASID